MEAIYQNFEPEDPVLKFSVSNPPASIKSNRRCYLCVITFMVMLSVLLLAGLVILGLLYGDSVRNLSEISDSKDNLTEHLNAVIERMNSSLIETTKKLMDFKQKKTGCSAEWIGFGSSCYFFSVESKSWDEARESCRAREADLVVINTNDEKTFIFASSHKPVWIGLTDKVQEGTWKWVDGSPLTLQFWGDDQPDNGGGIQAYGEEDCVQIRYTPGSWNDIACKNSQKWICEKEATLYV
ncbi:C-type lectin domain family 17, member A-like isoform X2 [Oryzias latipes]|uniref:C-type lectin domain family 17, member A-like isoform X2 n=1 Tax=Oryzias latipes TaxID=8090 RepID=UPI0009DB5E4C|nr:C-type lectin domain family 17, member A-like isoform X2 [Oryzias latipes]